MRLRLPRLPAMEKMHHSKCPRVLHLCCYEESFQMNAYLKFTSCGLEEDNLLCLATIWSVDPNIVPLVTGTKSFIEAWSCLERTDANASRSHKLNLKTTLARINMDTMSVNDYLLTIKHMANDLALIGALVSEDELLLHVLNDLNLEYKKLGVVMCAKENPISFKKLHHKLIHHEIYLKRNKERKESFRCYFTI
ncbi:hypothetical protein PVL29_022596 [Vitis rotundifolia]|uniref:Uncharacterized protein n=1 Tax=Vitis rotundifolia TaxID=103349 RepID=A0AA39DCY8_VITRO|nr:hypothetical protein PVL29_022596 [Vitis rotundifolia]